MSVMTKRRHQLDHAPAAPEDMVPVLVPAGWMRTIGEKLDRLLSAAGEGDGPRPAASSAPGAEKPLSRKEAADYTGYNKRTLDHHIGLGTLKATGLRRDRIARSELDRWMTEMANRRRPPTPANQTANEADVDAIVDRLINDKK